MKLLDEHSYVFLSLEENVLLRGTDWGQNG